MKNIFLSPWSHVMAIGSVAFILAACGGENVNQTGGDDDSSVDDSEAVAISLDSLVGYSQKGPFLKGSTVYLYELSDGKTLKQTSGNFTSIITRDDGRYKFSARDLASQYAMLVVDGYYRNEVTGESSNAPIRLRALTDMRKRSSANVNLLTHLEYDRVYNLVTREGKTVKQAKKQAQAEIFEAFHIDTTGFGKSSEDLDVFGSSEADAALLAISILLQGDRTESELPALLAELSDDLSDGKWDDDAMRAEIADSALLEDLRGGLAIYRNNVKGWGLSNVVPHFEKYIRRFASIENGLGVCGSDSVPVGTVKKVSNSKSRYYAKSYTDTTSVGYKTRFICVDADSAKWREATGIEKDRFNWNPENTKDGLLLNGPVTGNEMVWDGDTLRYADYQEVALDLGCTSYNANVYSKSAESDYAEYGAICNVDDRRARWRGVVRRKESKFGILNDVRDGKKYYTIEIGSQTWMAENLNFDYKVDGSSYGSFTNTDNGEIYGRYYTREAAMDFAGIWSSNGKGCREDEYCSPVRGVCPEGWHLPTNAEWRTLFSAVRGGMMLAAATGWIGGARDFTYENDFAFSALPAGCRDDDGNYNLEGDYAFFWSSTEGGSGSAYVMSLYYLSADVRLNINYENYGFSVRCLKD